MARVAEPRARPDRMLICKDCSLDEYACQNMALFFSDGRTCPPPETYQEAVEYAELAEKEAQR